VETGGGFLFGKVHEYVTDKSGNIISRLDWQEDWIPYIIVMPKFAYLRFFIAADFLCTIPLGSNGNIVEDYDYLIENTNVPSLYSRHDSYLDKHYEISGRFGYEFEVQQWDIALAAGFQYRAKKWSAVDGYLQYPENGEPWSGYEPKKTVTGTSISYEQAIWITLLSLEFKYNLKNWTFGASGKFFPYVWADSLDTHFIRQIQFYDEMSGGIGGNCEISISYTNKKLKYINFVLSGGIDIVHNVSGKSNAGKTGIVEGSMQESISGSKFESENWYAGFAIKIDK
jgi:outer membrane protease